MVKTEDFKTEIVGGFLHDIFASHEIDYTFVSYIREYLHRYRDYFDYNFRYEYHSISDEYISVKLNLPYKRSLMLRFYYEEIVIKKTQNVFYFYNDIVYKSHYNVLGCAHLHTVLTSIKGLESIFATYNRPIQSKDILENKEIMSKIIDLKEKTTPLPM